MICVSCIAWGGGLTGREGGRKDGWWEASKKGKNKREGRTAKGKGICWWGFTLISVFSRVARGSLDGEWERGREAETELRGKKKSDVTKERKEKRKERTRRGRLVIDLIFFFIFHLSMFAFLSFVFVGLSDCFVLGSSCSRKGLLSVHSHWCTDGRRVLSIRRKFGCCPVYAEERTDDP